MKIIDSNTVTNMLVKVNCAKVLHKIVEGKY